LTVYENKHNCSGCTACMNLCPNNAIIMAVDNEGFSYPQINETKCSQCGLCRKICPFHENYNVDGNYNTPKVYAVKHVDEDVRISSTSGGMFTALSDLVLEKNGVVYGAVFDEHFRVCHHKAESKAERDKMKGSKYVQSDLNHIFLDIKNELNNGKYVLFTGTPCQVAGLKAFFNNAPSEKLILCDLICHGTPSPLIWKEYISLLKKKKKSNLKYFKFRDKGKGWHKSRLYAEFDDGSKLYDEPLIKLYNSIFYQHVALRPSCHHCVFTNLKRPSDITIGDFWGIEKYKQRFDDNKGVSLVLINTEKGEDIFQKLRNNLIYETSSVEECVQQQRHLTVPASCPSKRKIFWEDYYSRGFKYVARKYTTYGPVNRLKYNILKPILSKLGILNFAKSKLSK